MSSGQLDMEAGAEGKVRNEILIWESYSTDGIPSHWAACREWIMKVLGSQLRLRGQRGQSQVRRGQSRSEWVSVGSRAWPTLAITIKRSRSMRAVSQWSIGFGNRREKSFSGYRVGIKPDGKKMGGKKVETVRIINSWIFLWTEAEKSDKLEVIWDQR